MNTVKIGNDFELKSYDVISKAIENGELGITSSSAKVFKKKGYYSKDREKDIIFDLSIEIWPNKAERFTLLYLIECKSSNSKNVPVDDVEEFYSKIIQVAGVNVKGVMITNNSFQEGGITFARNKGMMLIEVNEDGDHEIKLYKTDKILETNDPHFNIDEVFEAFIKKILGLREISGLKRLSSQDIEICAYNILSECNQQNTPISINDFLDVVKNKYGIKIEINSNIDSVKGKVVLGYYSKSKNKIYINPVVANTSRYAFIIGHELGHYFLHQDLKMNQDKYNDFRDSEYDFFVDKFMLINEKNWMEWQANRFSISLFLPKDLFLNHLYAFRKSIGINKYMHIYLDDQWINKDDYRKTVDYLSLTFGISKVAIKYRIEELNIITHAESVQKMSTIIRKIFI